MKSIVDMHGGRISVESRLGAGTTFVVTLPRDPRTETVAAPPPAPVDTPERAVVAPSDATGLPARL